MMGEPQLTLVLASVAAVHLLVLAYAALRGTPQQAERASGDGGQDGVVVCPDCEAENEPDYRYCRGCAGELPGVGARPARSRPVGDGDLL
jgi:hypothetical protein